MTPAEVAATRRLIGLTVDQLADRLGVNPRTVRGWESGKYSPGPGVVLDLRELRDEHDFEADQYGLKASIGQVVSFPKGSGWYLAIAARVLDREPSASIEWSNQS